MEDAKGTVAVPRTDVEVGQTRSEGPEEVSDPGGEEDAVEELDDDVYEDVCEDEEEMHPDTMRGQATMACQGWSMLYSSIRSALSGAVHGKAKEDEVEADA
eukprot:jgi/Pico_ML_1/52829/g3479.t1